MRFCAIDGRNLTDVGFRQIGWTSFAVVQRHLNRPNIVVVRLREILLNAAEYVSGQLRMETNPSASLPRFATPIPSARKQASATEQRSTSESNDFLSCVLPPHPSLLR